METVTRVLEPPSSYYRARYYDPTTGRFLSEDPIRFAGSKNFYKYVANNPTNAIDLTGLRTIVIIVYDPGPLGIGSFGSHAAVYIDNGGDPILYDPAGAFSADHHCGSGQSCSDADADPGQFKKFHERSGSTVKMFQFDTTAEEEKQIANNIDGEGGVIGGLCASATSSVISGVGPFKSIKPTLLPGSLADQLDKL
jgi:uncharacterized protein RhaS with RHS repeats